MIEISDSDMRTIVRQLPHIRDKTLRGINALRIIVLILWKLVRRFEKEQKLKTK